MRMFGLCVRSTVCTDRSETIYIEKSKGKRNGIEVLPADQDQGKFDAAIASEALEQQGIDPFMFLAKALDRGENMDNSTSSEVCSSIPHSPNTSCSMEGLESFMVPTFSEGAKQRGRLRPVPVMEIDIAYVESTHEKWQAAKRQKDAKARRHVIDLRDKF
mmetsp:Transcript_23668/g.54668  ORF Transcript_23668/g.54668 Transcript_23668/m.54668 type:complete len:160 (-) Transcript_23668:63-542(-)